MTKPLFVPLVLWVVAVALVSCATDNGDAVHGVQYGPFPSPSQRPDGSVTDGSAPDDGSSPR